MTVRSRRFTEKAAIIICSIAVIIAVGMLFLIIGQIAIGAIPSLSLHFILTPENKTGLGQGIANAIVGTILLSLTSTILATPFGIGTAIYLKRYATENRLTNFIRFMIEVLSGTPSVVVGMFGLLVLVIYLKPFTGGFSFIAGTIALAILIMPVVERAVESAIDTVNPELETGSYALGATKWQTIRGITLPAAINGILTSLILGFGRAAEESSVVLLTAGYSQFIPEIGIAHNDKFFFGFQIYPFNDLVGTMPYAVYNAYENSNVIPMSNAYAIALILVSFILLVNIMAKIICSRSIAGVEGSKRNSLRSVYKLITQRFRNLLPATAKSREGTGRSGEEKPHGSAISSDLSTDPTKSAPQPRNRSADLVYSVKEKLHLDKIKGKLAGKLHAGPRSNQPVKTSSAETGKKAVPKNGPVTSASRRIFRPFLRALLPFAIPLVILLFIAILAGIPPLHHILGPASPSLAALFSTSLTLIVAIAGLIFGLFVAKWGGAFRAKNRKAGVTGVAAGFCLVLAVAFVLSSAGSGLFNTGNTPVSASSSSASLSAADRSARLAALLASEGLNDESPAAQGMNPVTTATTTPQPASHGVPVRDALSLRENYQYGDPSHAIRATIYDVKVLPFYFWWWADWNRFVQQVPATGDSYLVVFIRIENTGKMSAIIPSADQFNVTYNGISYVHNPYFDMSLADQQTINDYDTDFPNIPYEWIRELGQDKRDYDYLMGDNIFEDQGLLNNTTATTATPALTPASAGISGWQENSSVTDMDYLDYNLKPGPSQAIDGYLIYEVPDSAVNDLRNTYMQVAFNGHSTTRWRLG